MADNQSHGKLTLLVNYQTHGAYNQSEWAKYIR